MGFKDFFVERVPEEKFDKEHDYEFEDEFIPAELDSVNTDSLIEDVYTQNELLDKSKSIFKVEDLINSLPKEMVTETKRASVLATLGVFGLTVTDVNLDGEKRVETLKSVLEKILTDGNDEISNRDSEIEDHKKEIARLEKEVSDKRTEMKDSETIINAEIGRISGLIKFVEGGAE